MVEPAQLQWSEFSCGKTCCIGLVWGWNQTWNWTANLEPLATLHDWMILMSHCPIGDKQFEYDWIVVWLGTGNNYSRQQGVTNQMRGLMTITHPMMIHILLGLVLAADVNTSIGRLRQGDLSNMSTSLEGWSNMEIRVIVRGFVLKNYTWIIQWPWIMPEI